MSDSSSSHIDLGIAVITNSVVDEAGVLHLTLLMPRAKRAHRIRFTNGTAIVYGSDTLINAVLIAKLTRPSFASVIDTTILAGEELTRAMESRDSMATNPQPEKP